MVKGADAVMRKKNKERRKKMRGNEPVSARVAAIIASKRRRKAGKRRICEGLCFSLPTPEDPFNDRNDPKVKKSKKASLLNKETGNIELLPDSMSNDAQLPKSGDGSLNNRPSKFLCSCLNAIQSSWTQDDVTSGDFTNEPLLASRWGFEFWRSYSTGSDILDTSGQCASKEQVAWLVSTASDSIARKEKEGCVIASPFLLFLVPSQEKAAQVRSVCKPLKEFGIQTVSLHPGASIAHQVYGLKCCEPEFLVSTPERLLELVFLKAVDISGVSLLAIDGLESFISSGFEDKIKSIRVSISGTPQTVVFSRSHGKASIGLTRSLVKEPVCRFS